VQQADAEVAQTEAELRSKPSDTLLLEKLRYARLRAQTLRKEKSKLLDRLPLPQPSLPTYSETAPFYSTYLAEEMGMEAPYEQYGLYLTSASGIAYCVRQLYRARQLMKAVNETDAEKRLYMLDDANVGEQQLVRAGRYARRFCVTGIAVAMGAPLLWVCWRMAHHAKRGRRRQ
jgi:hypothetical protein